MPSYTVHYEGPTHSGSDYQKGKKVGGPYKDKNRARNAVDKHDNKYGAYVHRIREAPDAPLAKDATANLMKEERLTKAADQKHGLAEAVYRDEEKLPKTAEALGILGAGKAHGGN